MNIRSTALVFVSFVLLILIVFIAHVYFYRDTIIDEAFISFRYAKNWAEGYGPVFNHGERVEGYTNFLMVAWLTEAFKVSPHLDPLLFVKMIGGFSAFFFDYFFYFYREHWRRL